MSGAMKVLITGATGKQGGAVLRRLLKSGHAVRALTRKTDSPAAAALRAQGVEVVGGDFEDRATLVAAARGVDAAFLMSTGYEAGVEAETRQGINAVDAAKEAKAPFVLYTSVGSADQKTGIPHFDSKYRVEEHLRKTGIAHAVIAPVYFFENAFAPWVLPSLKEGSYASPLTPGRVLQQVAVDDIGGVAAHILEHPGKYAGRRFDLASDELTGPQLARIVSEASGKRIEYKQIPIAAVRAMSEDFALMYEWFERVGYGADLAGLRREFPAVGWHGFKAWAKKQDWSALG